MPSNYWFAQSIIQTLTASGYIIVITTDTPCHLWMRWTTIVPKEHNIQRVKRGLPLMVDKYFCFDVYEDNEQEEAGDTLEHTFIKEPWPVCETRYFYFHGEIASVASKSTTAIFKKHRVYVAPPPESAYFYPDPHPEVSSVDGFTFYQGTNKTWTYCVNAPGNLAMDGPANLEVMMYCYSILNRYRGLRRLMIVFDTRTIPLGATIVSASLDIYTKNLWDPLSATPSLVLTPCSPASVTELIPADYQTITNEILSDIIPWGSLALSTWSTLTLNAAGLLKVTPDGWTKLALRFHPYDVLDVAPPWVSNKYTSYQCRSADAELINRPKLTVNYLP